MAGRASAQYVIVALSKRVEAHLKSRLVTVGGIIIGTQLPQTWSFQVDAEAFSFVADKKGNVTVTLGLAPNADVVVTTTYDRLMAALNTGSPGETPPSPLGVKFGSNRGRRGYFYVRKNLKI